RHTLAASDRLRGRRRERGARLRAHLRPARAAGARGVGGGDPPRRRVPLRALGVSGAAIATVVAFASGAILGLVLLARGRLVLALRGWPLPPRFDVIRRVLRIGYPAAIEHLLMQIGFFLYIVFAAHYGTAAVAA